MGNSREFAFRQGNEANKVTGRVGAGNGAEALASTGVCSPSHLCTQAHVQIKCPCIKF